MLSRNELKYFSGLNLKKHRREEKKFLVEGLKQVAEGLNSDWICDTLFYTEQFELSSPEFLRGIEKKVGRVEEIRSQDFNRLSDTKSPQGVIAVFHEKEFLTGNFDENKPVVLLENISDPGNAGTILRTCDWFGFVNVILSGECAEIYNPKVVRSTMGSLFHLNIVHSADYLATVRDMKDRGCKILCADIDGQSYKTYNYDENIVLVFSSESHGPSQEIIELSDARITIDKAGQAESLNVASAVAVILAEVAASLNS